MKYQAVILDLGGVVIDIDFHRVFNHWAEAGQVPVSRFYDRWALDAAYEQHETGDLDFAGYMRHLGQHFEVEMPLQEWERGWNEIFVGLYGEVLPLLHEVSARRPLFAFTNTNATHEATWRERYPELGVFQHIFVSSTIGQRKPDVPAYEYVAAQVGAAPEQILFLDDNTANIEGARAAGLDARQAYGEAEVVSVLRAALAGA